MVLDGLPVGVLDDFEAFRNKKFSFLYLCKSCLRSYDSVAAETACKFCSGPIVELRSVKKERHLTKTGVKKSVKYRYFCSTCDKSFTTTQKMTFCTNCKTNYLHVYTWDMLKKRERFYIKLNKALRTVIIDRAKSNKKDVPKKEEKSVQKRFAFSRPREELPTY